MKYDGMKGDGKGTQNVSDFCCSEMENHQKQGHIIIVEHGIGEGKIIYSVAMRMYNTKLITLDYCPWCGKAIQLEWDVVTIPRKEFDRLHNTINNHYISHGMMA